MIYNGYDSDYDTLLKISGTCTMHIRRIKQLAIEIFKTANNLNPDFMKNIFKSNKMLEHVLAIYLSEVTILQHTVIKVLKS